MDRTVPFAFAKDRSETNTQHTTKEDVRRRERREKRQTHAILANFIAQE